MMSEVIYIGSRLSPNPVKMLKISSKLSIKRVAIPVFMLNPSVLSIILDITEGLLEIPEDLIIYLGKLCDFSKQSFLKGTD